MRVFLGYCYHGTLHDFFYFERYYTFKDLLPITDIVTLHTFRPQSVFDESLQNGETITPFTEQKFLVGCWFVMIFVLN